MLNPRISSQALNTLFVDRLSAVPVYQQLCAQIRHLIEGRRLVAGVRLPSSRDLSKELGISRKTVVNTYDQLIAEGYLATRQGAGTFVEAVPEIDALEESRVRGVPRIETTDPKITESQKLLAPCVPDRDHFPRSSWSRAAARGQRKLDLNSMFYDSTTGYAPLKKAIADHLRAMRGLVCHPDQVIITSGLVESIGLIGNSVLNPGERVLTEDPGYTKTCRSLQGTHTQAERVRVDQDGMQLEEALTHFPDTKAVIVTPSRQFPLGVQLSLSRRAHLINWANAGQGWIIEDDYDCEYRFAGRPLQAIYTMDKSGRTIYLGSLSKVLFPQLRISFIVAPPEAIKKLAHHQNQMGSLASMLTQSALCEFMASGQFSTHLRQMRRLYKNRYDYILEAVTTRLGRWLEAEPIDGGTQFTARFKRPLLKGLTDRDIVAKTNALGLGVVPLSVFYADAATAPQGLVIGFANTSEQRTDIGVAKLETVLAEHLI